MSRKKYDPKTSPHNHKGFSLTDRLMAFHLATQGGGQTPRRLDTHRLLKDTAKKKKSSKPSKGWIIAKED